MIHNHGHMSTLTHACARPHPPLHPPTGTLTHAHAHTRTHTRTLTHACAHTHTHSHTHTHTHAHTHAPVRPPPPHTHQVSWYNLSLHAPAPLALPSLLSLLYTPALPAPPPPPPCQVSWADVSLDWAETCYSRHLSCRSFHVMRALHPPLCSATASSLLLCLHTCFNSNTPSSRDMAVEVMATLRVGGARHICPTLACHMSHVSVTHVTHMGHSLMSLMSLTWVTHSNTTSVCP